MTELDMTAKLIITILYLVGMLLASMLVTMAWGWFDDRRKPTRRNRALTVEQVKQLSKIMDKHWHDLPDEYGMPEASALPEYSYDWHAITDEFNAIICAGDDAE